MTMKFSALNVEKESHKHDAERLFTLAAMKKAEEVEAENKMRRRFSIVLSWVIILAALIQFSMFSSILQPFLSMLDPDVSDVYGPWVVVAYSFGQMITPPLFGLWTNKTKRCKLPMTAGMVVIVLFNVVYCCLESFPTLWRKWVMLVVRVFVGLGSGSTSNTRKGGIVSVARTYCATASTKNERQVAIAGSTAALGFSVIAGPGAQGLFSLVGYPGVYVNAFHLHSYNAPAVASIVVFLVLIFLNSTFLLEEYPGIERASTNKTLDYDDIALPKYDKMSAWTLVWCWFCTWTALTNFVILGVPFTQAQFDWSLPDAIMYNGVMFGAFAVFSLIIYSASAFLSEKFEDRHLVLTGMMLIGCFYMMTFPWPFYDLPASGPNGSNSASSECSYAEKSWCFTTPRIPPFLYLISLCFMGVGFPLANASLSTLLSKVLGPRKQGMMQGIYVTSGGLARLLGPLLIRLQVLYFY